MISFKKLYEDATLPYGNRFVAGIASRELKSNPIQMSSLFDTLKQHPNDTKSDNAIPAELQPVPQVLGQLELNIDNLLNSYETALQNPTITKKNHLKAALMLLKIFRKNFLSLVELTKKIVDNK